MTDTYKEVDLISFLPIKVQGHCHKQFDKGEVLVIIIIVSAKQVYNGKVNFSMKLSYSISDSVFHSVLAFNPAS